MKKIAYLMVCLLAWHAGAVMARAGVEAGARAFVSQIATQATAVATEPTQAPTPPTAKGASTSKAASSDSASTTETITGYLEIFGGFGEGYPQIGTSRLIVVPSESDRLDAGKANPWRPFAQAGLGYIYYLQGPHARDAAQWEWLPTVEPMLTVVHLDALARGKVYLFGITAPGFDTNTFTLHSKATNLMLEGVLTLASWRHIALNLRAGGGVAWLSNVYQDQPRPGATFFRFGLHLAKRSTVNGVYQWGGGVRYALNTRLAVSADYLYTHVGNFKTSRHGVIRQRAIIIPGPASFSLRTNALFISLHWALT